jgi:hypothetical protein
LILFNVTVGYERYMMTMINELNTLWVWVIYKKDIDLGVLGEKPATQNWHGLPGTEPVPELVDSLQKALI